MFPLRRIVQSITLTAAVLFSTGSGSLATEVAGSAVATAAASVVKVGSGTLVLSGGNTNTTAGTVNIAGGTLNVGGGSLDVGGSTGGVIIINPGGGVVINPPLRFGGVYHSPVPSVPEAMFESSRPGSAAISGLADLALGLAPVAAVCDDTRLYMATLNGGGNTTVPYSASALWACDLQSASPTLELLHSFPHDGSVVGRALVLRDGWLYGTTIANNQTTACTVFRFHVATRVHETLVELPVGDEAVPVSLAMAPNGDLFILTSRAASSSRTLPFTRTHLQTAVLKFPPDAVSGALFRVPAGGAMELTHTFRPGGLPGMTTIALNLPSEIVCDTDGILYGTTTGRRLFTLVPGETVRWMQGNPEDTLGEGSYESTFIWDDRGAGMVAFQDRRVPLHVTERGIRFHPSSRGTPPIFITTFVAPISQIIPGGTVPVFTITLRGGHLIPELEEKWPAELEHATQFLPAGPGRVVALLESGSQRRLVVASDEEGLRPLPHVTGFGGSGIVARASDDTIFASDVVMPAAYGEPWPTQRLKKLVLAGNTPPSPVADVFGGDSLSPSGSNFTPINARLRFFGVTGNDLDAEGDRLRIAALSNFPTGALALALNSVQLIALPATPVFEFSATYEVSDGFGGRGSTTVTFRNRPPSPELVSREYDPAGISISAADLGMDPDGDQLSIKSITGGSLQISEGGTNARITVPRYGDYGVTIGDKLGAQAVATLRVIPAAPVDVVQQLDLIRGSGGIAFPSSEPLEEELSASILEAAADGTVEFAGRVAHYRARKSFTGFDTFKYAIHSARGIRATVTVQVRDGVKPFVGTYHSSGSGDRSLMRLTIGKKGRYTFVHRVGGRVFRLRGALQADQEWIIPRRGGNLVVAVRLEFSPDPQLTVLTGLEGEPLTPLTMHDSSELSALRAPRVHAELTTTAITPPKVIFVGGAFHPVGAPTRRSLPRSFAIIMRTAGGGAAITGRLYDGRPWSGAGFVNSENELAVVSEHYTGTLFARANGNVVGTLRFSGSGRETVLSTFAGSPFRAAQPGRNAFGGIENWVAGSSAFPADFQFGGAIGSDGRLSAKFPHGITHDLQVRSADGVLAGSISAPWFTGARPVHGLYIPHKKRVVGFAGGQFGQPITFQQK